MIKLIDWPFSDRRAIAKTTPRLLRDHVCNLLSQPHNTRQHCFTTNTGQYFAIASDLQMLNQNNGLAVE